MTKNLLHRAKFAELVGVNPSNVTRACKTVLAPACVGKLIDVDHPAAVEYLEKVRIVEEPLPGIDPLYETTIALAQSLGRLTVSSVARKLHIGFARAGKLVDMVQASGVLKRSESVATVTSSQVQEAQRLLDGGNPKAVKRAELEAAAAAFRIEQSMTSPTDDSVPLPTDEDLGGAQDLGDWTLRDLVKKFGTAPRFKDWLACYKTLIDINAKEIANEEKRGKLIPREFVQTHILSHYDRAHINLMTDAKQTITRRIHSDIKAGMTVEDCEIFVGDQISRHIREAKASIERALTHV